MPARPTEMKWTDGVRLAITLGSALAAAFTPLTLLYGSQFVVTYVSSPPGISLDKFSIIANMSLLLFGLTFASGLFAGFFVGSIFLDGWLKLLISVDLAAFGLGGIATKTIDYMLIGALCLLLLALMWITPISRFVRSDDKRVIVWAWIISAILLLILYRHFGIGPLRADPFSDFGPVRIQFALFGVDIYLALFFWVSLNIFKKNPLAREKEEPVLYVSPRTYLWMRWYLLIIGATSFIVCLWLSNAIERFGVSKWACLILFLLGHLLFLFSLLARLLAKKLMWMRLSDDDVEVEEALNSIKIFSWDQSSAFCLSESTWRTYYRIEGTAEISVTERSREIRTNVPQHQNALQLRSARHGQRSPRRLPASCPQDQRHQQALRGELSPVPRRHRGHHSSLHRLPAFA